MVIRFSFQPDLNKMLVFTDLLTSTLPRMTNSLDIQYTLDMRCVVVAIHKSNNIHVSETLAADATDLPGAVEDRVETESEGFGSSAASSAGKVRSCPL